jgi:N-acetyl-gamma-glutamyl-phosphate reductase
MPSVFIDGEAGTTGLEIFQRLAALPRIAVRSVAPERRKDPDARRELMSQVDVCILCLPDAAAVESAALAASLGAAAPRLLDASTAHRVHPDWVYGVPELTPGQPERIAAAARVANPGCYPTGAILLLRPLVDAGLLPADHPISVNAISGYSGGGRSMIEAYEDRTGAPAFELYALSLHHKHLPELRVHAGLTRRPIFVPSVGRFRQGMIVSIPLHLDTLPARPIPSDLHTALAAYYAGAQHVRVLAAEPGGTLEPEALNGSNRIELRVHASADGTQAVLTARLDNLGKGASGAAVQNLGLMLGVPVETALPVAAE